MEVVCTPSAGNAVTIAEIAEAEVVAALNQLVRSGVLRRTYCDQTITLFWNQVRAGDYRTVSITSAIVRRAADLCAVHPLKGYDAVQLACALSFRDAARSADAANTGGGPTLGEPIFLTEDNRLGAAAAAEWFVIDSPLAHP